MRTEPCERAPVDAHACVCEFEQSPQMCSSRLDFLFTEPTHWQSFPHCERHTPKHIQTSLPGSTVKLIYLSIASPVCLSSNPFHHSVILLSVCLHSSVIIRQKIVTHTSSPELIRLYTSLRSKLQEPPERHTHAPNSARTHVNYTVISFVVTFLSLSSQMPNCYIAIIGSSLCQRFNCSVNIHYHFPSAAIIRLLTELILWRSSAKPKSHSLLWRGLWEQLKHLILP